MAQRLLYSSTQKASNDQPGITKVDLEKDGVVIELGTVQAKKGAKIFSAFLPDGTSLGEHDTKKQAGGALKKHFDAGGAVPSATMKVVDPQPDFISKENMEVAKPEPKPELRVLPAPKKRPSALDPKPQEAIPASNWTPPREADGSIDFSFDPNDPIDIPNWLKRTTPKQRLMAALKNDEEKAA